MLIGKEVTGFIHCIVQVLDIQEDRKELIGKRVCYVRKGEEYCSDQILMEDLQEVIS